MLNTQTHLCTSEQKLLISVIILGMAKDVVKLYRFHSSSIFNAERIPLFNSSAFTAPSKFVCLDNLKKKINIRGSDYLQSQSSYS